MLDCFVTKAKHAIPITLVKLADYEKWLPKQAKTTRNWLQAVKFVAKPAQTALIPNTEGELQQVICCVADSNGFWSTGSLPFALPPGIYQLDQDDDELNHAIAFGLGAYQFQQYKKPDRKPASLLISKTIDANFVQNIVKSIYLVRDLINTPTDDLGPTEFAKVVQQLSQQYQARFKQWIGEALLKNNYPCIYTVGRASDDPPRLLDFRWGKSKHPKVTLIGKGVCFDSGGLDIKPSSAMLLMKKDMGGGAHVLGLAKMIMEAKLPIALRVLIPTVENVISGNAYRPGDVIRSRKGLTIEIGNTDAEGRLILADALTEAVSETPDLLIDITTLTGAARVALGTELPAVFSNNERIVNELLQMALKVQDPLWQLPLFELYRDSLNSTIADLNNCSPDGYGGAITAALFLKEFVPNDIPWLHFDLMAWNLKPRPGRPQGGEAMGLRALFHFLAKKYK